MISAVFHAEEKEQTLHKLSTQLTSSEISLGTFAGDMSCS
jgi:hypothetical protein